jgi:hypothetical protein
MACTHSSSSSSSGPSTLELAFGIGLILFGVVLTLDVMGVEDVTRLLRVWPAALVLAGVTGLSRSRDSAARLWAWAWIVTGAWLLLRNFGLTRVGFWDLVWPIALTALGVKLGLDAWRRQSGHDAAPRVSPHASHLVAIFGGSRRQVQEHPFLGASMTACFGGCELDLRHSDIPAGGEAVIELFALFGGHEIKVPEHWDVVLEATPIAAGVEDKRSRRYATPNPTRPRVVVKGMLVFSGLTLRD